MTHAAGTSANRSKVTPLLTAGKQRAHQGFLKALDELDRQRCDDQYEHLWIYRSLERELEGMGERKALPSLPTYSIGSLFLSQCKALLTRDDKEYIFYVTGTETNRSIYLTTVITFECSKRSATGVHGDPESVLKAVLQMEQAGHRLYGWFHSHPGSRDGCAPSNTDIGMQKRLESLKYPAIGGIFTRDGYLRFFSVEHKFNIHIYGKGIENVQPETFLYKINLSRQSEGIIIKAYR
jgi:proteasome lid subunit RPN8/RPN11